MQEVAWDPARKGGPGGRGYCQRNHLSTWDSLHT